MSILRQLIDLNMRYQTAMGRATLEYIRGVFSLLMTRGKTAPAQPASAILLEAEAGTAAVAAFAVANHLPRAVTATFDLAPFRDERGAPARVEVAIDPPRVSLAAAQQAVVRIAAAITDELAASTSYSSLLSIPGLADRPIPVIVRRTPRVVNSSR